MKRAPRSNPEDRIESESSASCASIAVLLALSACRSATEREIALALSARGLPGAGVGAELSQRLLAADGHRLDFELGVERQELSDEGPGGDDWTRIWAGLRGAPPAGTGLQVHGGLTWLRSEGETSELSDPGDYGGAYLGLGWLLALGPALDTGPDLSFLYVDSEGDRSGSGAVFELAWRLVWRL